MSAPPASLSLEFGSVAAAKRKFPGRLRRVGKGGSFAPALHGASRWGFDRLKMTLESPWT